jgi:crotonobetaine/carnitine-CoA ligase
VSRQYTGAWVVSSLLAERAERFGTEVAVASEQGTLTYADLVERAARVAGGLAALGARPGDRVATMLPTGNDYLAAWHGCVWLGAIEVPVNVEYRGSFLEHILRDSGATILIVHARWLQRLTSIELTDMRHVVVVGEPEEGVETPAGIAAHAFADVLGHAPMPRHPAGELDLTYIMYTSGTTGRSKGAVHNNRSSMHYIMPFVEGLDLGDDDVCYSMFPLFHQMGRSACTTAALWAGNRVELRSGFSASHFWDDIHASGATWMGYFGAVILFLWQNAPSPRDRGHLLTRAFGSSAAPELIVPWQERFGVTLWEVYGSTEIGLGSGLGPDFPRKLDTMGLPCRQVEVAIVDENDNPLPPGQVGEAVWRPREPFAIFQGYWNLPQATLDVWRNLWFHSGDAALIDEEGYFVFKDRIKDTIRRRGENISSFEVEVAVRAEPGVVECAAYAVLAEGAPTEEEVMIAVVPSPDGPPDPESLFRALCRDMPRFAVPRYLRFLDELPKTPTQRVQKFKLRSDGVTPDAIDREALGIFPPRD